MNLVKLYHPYETKKEYSFNKKYCHMTFTKQENSRKQEQETRIESRSFPIPLVACCFIPLAILLEEPRTATVAVTESQ